MDSVLQKSPYPRRNSATILNYLEELILINAKEVGPLPITENNEGYQDIEINAVEAKKLTVPQAAVSALVMVEADTTSANLHRVLRFKENGAAPSKDSGFGLGDNDVYHITGKENLSNFTIIGIENDKKHFVRIQYYKTTQRL